MRVAEPSSHARRLLESGAFFKPPPAIKASAAHTNASAGPLAAHASKTTPEEASEKLMEVAAKAKENGFDYALGQVMGAADRLAENPLSRG